MISKLKLSSGGFMKTSVKLVSCLLFFTLLMTISCSSPQTTETKSVAPENELVGVWKIAEIIVTGPQAQTITEPGPGFLIITKKYVSYAASAPRAALPKVPTDAQLAAAFMAFSADTSTYEVNGNTITQHYIMGLAPNLKQGDIANVEYKLDGDNLSATVKSTQAGPIEYPVTTKYVRVE
jgi:hypothetical protein